MGRFTLRLPDSLHQELENQADQEGVSLNQFIVYALTRQISSGYTVQVTPKTALREQRARYDALLASLGSASDEETQQFLNERPDADDALPADLASKLDAKLKGGQ